MKDKKLFIADGHHRYKTALRYSKKHGYEVSIISPVKIDSHVVSSSVIRKFILKGDVETAAKFLGRSFKIK